MTKQEPFDTNWLLKVGETSAKDQIVINVFRLKSNPITIPNKFMITQTTIHKESTINGRIYFYFEISSDIHAPVNW